MVLFYGNWARLAYFVTLHQHLVGPAWRVDTHAVKLTLSIDSITDMITSRPPMTQLFDSDWPHIYAMWSSDSYWPQWQYLNNESSSTYPSTGAKWFRGQPR